MSSKLMTADVAGRASRSPVGSARWHQRLFFTGIPIAMAAAVFVGFAPTYYLKTASGTPALAPLYHLHGLLFSLWMVLLVAQPALVAARRINLHRRLGAVGGVLAAVMVPTALAVALDQGRRGAAPPGVPPLSFLAVSLAAVIVFPVLIGAALLWRRQPEMHKRLILIGTLELVTPGVGRWPGLATAGPLAFFWSHGRVPGRDRAVRHRDTRSPASGHDLGRAVPDRVSGSADCHQRDRTMARVCRVASRIGRRA
jgi:hypothetical protein